MINNRLNWISSTKFVAIIAVVIVHCNELMYKSNYIAMATSFSVSLFVLLSGVGTYLSYMRNPDISVCKQISKIKPLIETYVLATVILYILYNRKFIISDILNHIVHFDVENTYYFIFFFVQLKLISPLLIKYYSYCNSKKHKTLMHIISLIIMLVLSSLSIRYTLLTNLYGGGKHLFGGTYLFVYYLGIVSGPIAQQTLSNRNLIIIFLVSLVCWLQWSVWVATYRLPFDYMLRPFLGKGDNPPGVTYIIFTLLTFALCFSAFQLLERIRIPVIEKALSVIVFLGDNTLEIYLYHLAVQKLILEFVPGIVSHKWILRLVVFPMMIFIAPIIKCMINSAISRISQKYSNNKKDLVG